MDKQVVSRKPNRMIQAGQSLTPIQAKILYAMIAKVAHYHIDADKIATKEANPNHLWAHEDQEQWLDIPVEMFVEDASSLNGGELYRRIKIQAEEMVEKTLLIEEDDEFLVFSLLSACKMKKGESVVHTRFSPDTLKLLHSMKSQGYTPISLAYVVSLKSSHSIRLYEIIRSFYNAQWIWEKGLYYDLKELWFLFGLTDRHGKLVKKSYGKWYDFSRYVLDTACEEVSKKTDLIVSYRSNKIGRSVVGVTFLAKKKPEPPKEVKAIEREKDAVIDSLIALGVNYQLAKEIKKKYPDEEFIRYAISYCEKNATSNPSGYLIKAIDNLLLTYEKEKALKEAEAKLKAMQQELEKERRVLQKQEQEKRENDQKEMQQIIANYESQPDHIKAYVKSQKKGENMFLIEPILYQKLVEAKKIIDGHIQEDLGV